MDCRDTNPEKASLMQWTHEGWLKRFLSFCLMDGLTVIIKYHQSRKQGSRSHFNNLKAAYHQLENCISLHTFMLINYLSPVPEILWLLSSERIHWSVTSSSASRNYCPILLQIFDSIQCHSYRSSPSYCDRKQSPTLILSVTMLRLQVNKQPNSVHRRSLKGPNTNMDQTRR
jgi:hypothetical protein